MSDAIPFTGERYLPGVPGEIAYEHVHRYAFAQRFAEGRRVLDAACGEGYGSALLAGKAASVLGIDIDAATIERARERYATCANLAFEAGSVASLPCADASFDAVVSFETVEHIGADDQRRMLAEFARVLVPGGLLIISSPNRVEYSERAGYRNPFHVRELDRDELALLLGEAFPAQRWYRQRRYLGSALWAEEGAGPYEALTGDASSSRAMVPPEATYFVVIAAASDQALAAAADAAPSLSIYADAADSEWARADHEASEALRLDALVIARERELDDARRRIEALGADLARHQRRAGELAAEHERQQAALVAQERIIAYRQSARWWLVLPWLRIRRAWERIHSA
jgi:SAM-dependent methyltransferase